MSRVEREVARSVADQLRNQARQASWASDPARWARDVLGVHMWSKQREISMSVVDHKRTVVASCHGTGKALEVSTPVATPSGPVPMGEVRPGMKVLGSDGKPVTVVASTGIHESVSYRITLEGPSGVQEVIASGDHLWPVLGEGELSHAEEATGRVGLGVHTGLWHHVARTVDTRTLLRDFDLGKIQVIPSRIPKVPRTGSAWAASSWMRKVFARRGCTDVMGRPALVWMSQEESSAPKEVAEVRTHLSGQAVSTLLHRRRMDDMALWTLSVAGSVALEMLPCPDDAAVARTSVLHDRGAATDPGWRVIGVECVGERRVQCIQVDAEDHLYLCGDQGVPTHNSMIASVMACWWISTRPVGEAIVVSTAPTYAQVNKILWEEIRKHHSTARRNSMPMIGRVTQGDEWKTDDGQILAFGRKPAHGDRHGFQGIHRRYVLAILDEACHDDQTEVMTEDGWKLFSALTGSERLLVMDQETHRASYRKPQKVVKKPYRGPMYLYEAKGANFCVTPDHDMYFHGRNGRAQDTSWRKAPMEELVGKTNKYMKKTITWEAPNEETFSIPAWKGQRKDFPARTVNMDDWMTFLGWYLSEGHLFKAGRAYTQGVGISQDDPAVLKEIYDLCVSLGLPAKMSGHQVLIYSYQIARHLEQFGESCLTKRVPQYARMASARQLNLLLDSYLRGDGYEKQGQGIIYTSSPQMANDLQEMILKTGRPSVVRKRNLEGQESDFGSHIATSSVDGYVVTRPHEDSKIKFYPQNLSKIDYDGVVYCASVPPEAMLLTRRNGYTLWSGNCGIPEEIWTGVEAITTNAGCRILAIGNPDDRNTEFGDVFLKDENRQDWNRVSVPASSTPNFTGEEVPALLNEVLVSKPWCEERLRAWGKDDPRYISKVEARFPEQSQSSLFPPALVAQAMEDVPPQPAGPVVRLGVDVARFGGDLNVVISHAGVTARIEDTWSGTDTVSSAHRVLKIAEDLRERLKASWVEIRVDAVGLGAGVVDTLNARAVLLTDPWFSVYEMHGSASPPVDVGGSVHGYGNARAYWFDQLRQSMRNGLVKMEEHEQVKDDLGMVFYEFRTGRLFIISKEQMRKDHGRSPDYADALAYATAPVAEGLPVGTTVSDPASAVSEDLEDLIDLSELSIAPY